MDFKYVIDELLYKFAFEKNLMTFFKDNDISAQG